MCKGIPWVIRTEFWVIKKNCNKRASYYCFKYKYKLKVQTFIWHVKITYTICNYTSVCFEFLWQIVTLQVTILVLALLVILIHISYFYDTLYVISIGHVSLDHELNIMISRLWKLNILFKKIAHTFILHIILWLHSLYKDWFYVHNDSIIILNLHSSLDTKLVIQRKYAHLWNSQG